MTGPSRSEPSAAEHIRANRAAWDRAAPTWEQAGAARWAAPEPTWGVFGVPEADLRVFPDDVAGADVVELGCGTGYVSAWLAQRGARPVGIDLSARQLASAARFQREAGVRFPLVQADAEAVPLAAGSFDLAISEYGASIWCDPYRWIPEAARLLRSGGELVFLVNGTILMLCVPDLESDGPAMAELRRAYFGMNRFTWPDDTSIEFHLGYGDWIRLLRANGFEIVDLIEVRPGADATTTAAFVDVEWARRWPCEEIWRARKR